MQRPKLVIQLSPSHIELGVLRGRTIVSSSRIELDPAQWEDAWEHRLRTLDPALSEALNSIEGAFRSASVFHRSPGATAEVFSCASRGNSALDAGRLALADHVTYPLETSPHEAQIISVDRSGAGRQTHVLLAADNDLNAQIIAEWLERAELKASQIIPIDAPLQIHAVQETITRSNDYVLVALRIGEHSSVLTAGGSGVMKIARRIDLDIEMLIDALTRPIIKNGAENQTISLSREQARTLLFTHGVPGRDDVLDESIGLRGSDILPAIQPVLQRCIVEMRQSLRFGLEEGERQTAQFLITGPGSAIPNLGEVLGLETDLQLDPSQTETPFDPSVPCAEGGDLYTACTQPNLHINLLPLELAGQVRSRVFQRAIWVGAALAALTAMGDAGFSWSTAKSAEQELATLQPSIEKIKQITEHRDATQRRSQGMRMTQSAIHKSLGAQPEFLAWFKELSNVTPPDVQLVEITASRTEAGLQTNIRGYVMSERKATANSQPAEPISEEEQIASEEPRYDVTDYIEALRTSPIVRSVSLGATHRTFAGDREALQFSMTIDLVEVPRLASLAQENTP